MFTTVTTNGAAILTLILLWSTLVWVFVYLYMNKKLEDAYKQLDYIEERFGHVIEDYLEHMYEGEDYKTTYAWSDGAWRRV